MLYDNRICHDDIDGPSPIRLHGDAAALDIPNGHVGPYYLPGSGRLIWWTGRVAIGLRHERPANHETIGQSAQWVQDLYLRKQQAMAA